MTSISIVDDFNIHVLKLISSPKMELTSAQGAMAANQSLDNHHVPTKLHLTWNLVDPVS